MLNLNKIVLAGLVVSAVASADVSVRVGLPNTESSKMHTCVIDGLTDLGNGVSVAVDAPTKNEDGTYSLKSAISINGQTHAAPVIVVKAGEKATVTCDKTENGITFQVDENEEVVETKNTVDEVTQN